MNARYPEHGVAFLGRQPVRLLGGKLPEGVRPKTDRTLAIWGNTIINSSSDNVIYALDAQTGQLVWETPVLDPRKRAPTSGGT